MPTPSERAANRKTIIRAFGNEPVPMIVVNHYIDRVEVRRKDSEVTVNLPATDAYEYDGTILLMLMQAHARGDDDEIERAWKEAPHLRTEAPDAR